MKCSTFFHCECRQNAYLSCKSSQSTAVQNHQSTATSKKVKKICVNACFGQNSWECKSCKFCLSEKSLVDKKKKQVELNEASVAIGVFSLVFVNKGCKLSFKLPFFSGHRICLKGYYHGSLYDTLCCYGDETHAGVFCSGKSRMLFSNSLWKQRLFQCLFFHVFNSKFSAPLADLMAMVVTDSTLIGLNMKLKNLKSLTGMLQYDELNVRTSEWVIQKPGNSCVTWTKAMKVKNESKRLKEILSWHEKAAESKPISRWKMRWIRRTGLDMDYWSKTERCVCFQENDPREREE